MSGLYQITEMPFGLNGAAASFQRAMNNALTPVQDCTVAYIDDKLVFSPSWETHIGHLWRVLEALQAVGLTASQKSKLWCSSVQYLGF